LRSNDKTFATLPATKRSFGEYTFGYFVAIFYNEFLSKTIFSPNLLKSFKTSILSSINSLLNKFTTVFPRFDVIYTYNYRNSRT
jgi:hypothetical protein